MTSERIVILLYKEEEKFFVNFNEKKHQSDIAFCSCFQILTQVVIIVTLFLCSVAYWILMTDQVNMSYFFNLLLLLLPDIILTR